MGRSVTLIDGYNLFYRCYGIFPDNPIPLFRVSLRKLLRTTRASHALMIYDSANGDLFRKSIEPTYKGNRGEKSEAERRYIKLAREEAAKVGVKTFSVSGRDGDDLLHTCALTYRTKGVDKEIVIASADKDMLQCVNAARRTYVYNPQSQKWYKSKEDVKAKMGVYPSQLSTFLALVGDSVDNVDGIPSVGEKTAALICHTHLKDPTTHPKVEAHAELFLTCHKLTSLYVVKCSVPSIETIELGD